MSYIYSPLLPAAADLLSGGPVVSQDGYIKIWNGSQWVIKPVKVWNGSQWNIKPVKVWNGSQWLITTPTV
jgi:hypothetical protein